MIDKAYTLDVKYNDEDEAFIELPEEVIAHLNLKVGDPVVWTDNKDGSWTLNKKKQTKLVLVETVSTFRQRYVVEVPEDGEDEWALDTVAMEEAVEFSQEHLGEQLVSHRVVSDEEALALCDKDNSYCKSWSDEKKREVFYTAWKE